MARTLTFTEELVVVVCWCGMHHAIPKNLQFNAEKNGTTVYCPLGHSWSYTESELDRTKAKLAAQTARLDQARARAEAAEAKAMKLAADAAKARKRAAAGVCPCCNRTFQNVARHMKTKHPDAAT